MIFLQFFSKPVNDLMQECVSKGIISYITAKVKCPLYGGRKDHHEPEAVAKVSGVAAGYGREDHPEGGVR